MDIVSRLKTFINHINIPVTQFADNCSIPRPTLSQLLNGRNKKVSDELIGKIHDAYPNLSVLWLMFGEGDMLHNKNIEISEPKPGGIFDFQDEESTLVEHITTNINFNEKNTEFTPNIFSEHSFEENIAETKKCTSNNISSNIDNSNTSIDSEHTNEQFSTISFQANQNKRVVNIIVYYSDNSFESFVPSGTTMR